VRPGVPILTGRRAELTIVASAVLTNARQSRQPPPFFQSLSFTSMSQQHRKVVKRARRKAYIRRKKAADRTAASKK